MRITLLTIGTHGDVRPYVALGKGLQAAGHRVRIGTHAEFETLITRQGLAFHAVEGNPREVLESAGGQQVLSSGGNFLQFLKGFKAAAVSAMRGGFDDCLAASADAELVIYSFFVMGIGIQIGEKLGIPSMPAYLQPFTPTAAFPVMVLPRLQLGGWLNRLSYRAAEQLFWQTFREVVDQWRRDSLRLPPMSPLGPFARLHSPRYPVLNGFSRHLVPIPADWPSWVHTTGFWFLEEDWQPPPELTAFLDAGEPPVYVGFGSMHTENPLATAELVAEALAATGQRGVLMTGWGGLHGQFESEHLFLLESAPHHWLFPRMRAVVHHGGAGTTAAGLLAGKPTVTVPFFGDQPFWAERVFAVGAGPRPLPQGQLSRQALALAIQQAIGSRRIERKAAEIGRLIAAENGVAQAVALIERLHRPAS